MLEPGMGSGTLTGVFAATSPQMALLYWFTAVESMLVSRPAFERWYRDYDTANPVGFAFREPTPDEQASGAHYIMIADWIERDPSKLPFPIDPFRR